MIIKEKYIPHSLIQIYDLETHELVYETHNMIVKTGRDIIVNSIFAGRNIKPNNFRLFFDTSNNQTTSEMTISNILENGKIYFSKDEEYSNQNDLKHIGYYDENNVYKVYSGDNIPFEGDAFVVKLNGIIKKSTENLIIYGLGLLYDKKDTPTLENFTEIVSGTDVTDINLFSRAYIDPVFIRPNRNYLVTYNLYF